MSAKVIHCRETSKHNVLAAATTGFREFVSRNGGAADINPYTALAAAIGSGLWGIEHRIEPDAAIEGNAYDRAHPPHRCLPSTLHEAAERLAASKPARALFGEAFVEHHAATRQWEEREFRKAITDWELTRYFEII
jgi:glutamine synthetase